MWYKFSRIIFALARDEHLKQLGVNDDIISFINSTTDNDKLKAYMAAIHQKPGSTLAELQNIPIKEKKETTDQHLTYFETKLNKTLSYLQSPNVQKINTFKHWAKHQLIKEFKRAKLTLNQGYLNDLEDYLSGDVLSNLLDFYNNTDPNFDINSFTFQQIIDFSLEWHKAMASQGSGKFYEPTKPENIIFKYGEDAPEYTIQKVISENDLMAEGCEDNLDHCVGSYFKNVQAGYSNIYSLRTEYNKPLVTIELNGDNTAVKQIKGKHNSEPGPEIKELLSQWFSQIPNIRWEFETDIDEKLDDLQYKDETDMDDHLDDILREIVNGKDDYGIPFNSDYDIEPIYSRILNIFHRSGHRGTNHYNYHMRYTANVIAKYAVIFETIRMKQAIEQLNGNKVTQEWFNSRYSTIHELEEIFQKHDEDLDRSWDFDHYERLSEDDKPDRDDFEDDRSYENEIERLQIEVNDSIEDENMKEWRKENLPYGFDDDIYQEMHRLMDNDQEYKELKSKIVIPEDNNAIQQPV